MFRSHLTYPHVASDKHTIGVSGDPSGALPGMGDDGVAADPSLSQPQIPAPIGDGSTLIKQLLLIGGIATVVYLILWHLHKKS